MEMDIQFGISTWVWTSPFSSETIRLFPAIKSMGYDVVEIPVEVPELIDGVAIKEALAANGLKAVVCGAFGPSRDLTHDDVYFQRNSMDYIRFCLELCHHLGTSFFAGPMYSSVGKARQVSPAQRKIEWDRASDNLRKVCIMAADLGLDIALEPLNRFESDLINNTADVMHLIDTIDHPAAKVLLDGFHMHIEEPDIEKAIALAGNKLIHVQVSENHRGTPGTGQTRWEALRKGLDAIRYNGVVSIESFTPDNRELAGAVCIWKPLAESQNALARDGLHFLKQWAAGRHTFER